MGSEKSFNFSVQLITAFISILACLIHYHITYNFLLNDMKTFYVTSRCACDNWIINIKGERTQRTTSRACTTVPSGLHEIFNKTGKSYIFKTIYFTLNVFSCNCTNVFFIFPQCSQKSLIKLLVHDLFSFMTTNRKLSNTFDILFYFRYLHYDRKHSQRHTRLYGHCNVTQYYKIDWP